MEDIKRAGSLLAAQRKRVAKLCAVCEKPIEGTGKRLYCSNACKVKAYQQRRRSASPEAPE